MERVPNGSSKLKVIAICATAVVAVAALIMILFEPFAKEHAGGAVGDVTAVRVADINPGSSDSLNGDLTPFDGNLFFAADDGSHGRELWRTDGTAAGTSMVADINQTSDNLGGSHPGPFAAAGGDLYFRAYDPTHGAELWKWDGSSATLVKDINPGTANSGLNAFVNVNGTLYFFATDGVNGYELWKSDGTSDGTSMVVNIAPGSGSSESSSPQMIDLNGTLFFWANDGTTPGSQLWKSDGTDGNATKIGSYGGVASPLFGFDGAVYFAGQDGRSNPGEHGMELWKSNGTPGGTAMVKDINPVVDPDGATQDSSPSDFTVRNGTLYFFAGDGTHGRELWKSDGTEGGTTLAADIAPAAGVGSGPSGLVNVGGTLFFAADSAGDEAGNGELWRFDGANASLVKEVNPATTGDDAGSYPAKLTNVDGTLFFSAEDPSHGRELWKSDGSAAGTRMVADISPGAVGSIYGDSAPFAGILGSTLVFGANDGSSGLEPWRTAPAPPPPPTTSTTPTQATAPAVKRKCRKGQKLKKGKCVKKKKGRKH